MPDLWVCLVKLIEPNLMHIDWCFKSLKHCLLIHGYIPGVMAKTTVMHHQIDSTKAYEMPIYQASLAITVAIRKRRLVEWLA